MVQMGLLAQLDLAQLVQLVLAALLAQLVAAEAVMERVETSFLPIILEVSNGCYINTNFYANAKRWHDERYPLDCDGDHNCI